MLATDRFLSLLGLAPRNLTWINGFLFTLCLAIIIILMIYIYENGWKRRAPGQRLAIALCAYVSGDMLLRFWTLLWRWQLLHHVNVNWMLGLPVPPLAIAINAIGAICFIREFNPSWTYLRWLAVVILCAGFATSALIF